jgi:NAD(P)H-hydrate epimerase
MATGGTGDVLTGAIGSLLAQGIPMVDAARAGVYVHGFAGDLAAGEKGQAGMVAGDITDFLPASFMALNAWMEDLQ